MKNQVIIKNGYEAVILQAGQPRAYADSYYHYLIKFLTGEGSESRVVEISGELRGYQNPVKRQSDKREFWESYITEIRQVGDRWELKITEPFLD